MLAIELSIIHDLVLAEVLLLEVSEAVRLNPALESELADVVVALASDDFTGAGLEAQPSHIMSLAILLVVALPDGVALELVWLRHKVVGRGDASGVRHLVAHHWDVHDGGLHAHHHLGLLLLVHHLGLRLWLVLRYRG